ncbi:MAG TPA: glycosyltransferase family 4 protein [Candidatus Limnocylindrales bacterium]|nr:glycosyltransferase family 4 protein [Candidatus Limnocylindrales bacterium]
MRIGMLCHYYPPHPGGIEIVVWNLARALARRHEVTIVTSAIGAADGTTVEDGITVVRTRALNPTERFGIPYPVPVGPGLRTAIQALASADVVHAHGALYATSIQAARLARREGIPLVVTEHVGFVQYPHRLINAIESAAWSTVGDRVVASARAVVTINARIQRWLAERYAATDLRFIGNGVDTARFHPREAAERGAIRAALGLPLDRPLVLFAGRDSDKKNLEAVLEMPRDDFHLVVCGARRGLTGNGLTDLGIVSYDQMPRVFGAVDVMVQASTGEGFPLVVQEALASGVAIAILWDPGYAASLGRDVVAACDTVESLGAAVRSLAADEALRRRLSRDGRAWAERHWSWDATAAAYEQLYVDVARLARRRAA